MCGLLVSLGFLLLSGYMFRAALRMRRAQNEAHPASGRFCHICGADSFKDERCDAGLHS